MVKLHIKTEHQKKAAALFRADYDFFRHADLKPQADYELNETTVDFFLYAAVGAYQGRYVTLIPRASSRRRLLPIALRRAPFAGVSERIRFPVLKPRRTRRERYAAHRARCE